MTAALARRGLAAAAIAVGLAIPFGFAPFRVYQLTTVLVFVVAVAGLTIITGFCGQVSLGHGAFFAAGAYVAAVLIADHGWHHLAVLPVAGLVTFVGGYLFGVPALRLHELQLALVTLSLAVITPAIVKRFEDVTGGSAGLVVPKFRAPEVVGLEDDQWVFLICLAVSVVMLTIAWNVSSGPAGRAMRTVRDHPLASAAVGVDVARAKTLAFALGSAFAGVAGAMYVWVVAFVSPESFPILLSVYLLAVMLVGGLGMLSGAVVGAFFLVYVPEWSTQINQSAPGVVFGGLLICVLYVAPRGITGAIHTRAARFLRPGALANAPAPVAAGHHAPQIESHIAELRGQ
jgi:branched-chain amino acid transport system permease protein